MSPCSQQVAQLSSEVTEKRTASVAFFPEAIANGWFHRHPQLAFNHPLLCPPKSIAEVCDPINLSGSVICLFSSQPQTLRGCPVLGGWEGGGYGTLQAVVLGDSHRSPLCFLLP